MENNFLKDYWTYCLESGIFLNQEIIEIKGQILLGSMTFQDVNTCYLVCQIPVLTKNWIETMLVSLDFINRIDLYNKLIDELDKLKIIDKDKVLSTIMFQPLYLDFTKFDINIFNMTIQWKIWDKETSSDSWEVYYPLVVSEISFS